MAGTTPSQGIPYAQRPDPFELTADLRGSFNKIDSVFAQTRGESTAALTAAQIAEVKAAQALLRALAIEDPVHVGPEAPADGEALWVDTDEDPTSAPGGDVFSADIVDASEVGRNVLTAPMTADGRRALNIWNGTLAHLDEGTDTAERTWEAKDLAEFVAAKAGAASWDDLTDKPDTYPPATHTHEITDVDGLEAALPRTTAWQVLGTVPGLTAGECLFRWANGQPQLSLKGVEWLAGASIPWTAMPAGSRIDFNARSSAILSGTASLATQRGIVAYYAGTNFIYMGSEASPMPMSGMITWTI